MLTGRNGLTFRVDISIIIPRNKSRNELLWTHGVMEYSYVINRTHSYDSSGTEGSESDGCDSENEEEIRNQIQCFETDSNHIKVSHFAVSQSTI